MSVYSDNDDNDIQMLTNVVKAEQDQNRPLSPPSERVTIDLTESDADASAHPNRDVDSDASVSDAAASRSAAETNLFAVGAAYDSIEAFKLVADQFARAQGFSCIKLKGNNRKDGVRYTQVIACDRTGSFKPKVKVSGKATRNKDSKKCGCEWFIRLNHDIEDGTYKISQASLAHNHTLLPPKFMRYVPANRDVPEHIKDEIHLMRQAGITTSNIQSLLLVKYGAGAKSWISKDIYNIVINDRLARQDFQAQDLLALLQRKRDEDTEFAYEFELDDQQRLMHVMWASPQQKRAYARFNDTIVFDNTYKCNYFAMPFGVFTGRDRQMEFHASAGQLIT